MTIESLARQQQPQAKAKPEAKAPSHVESVKPRPQLHRQKQMAAEAVHRITEQRRAEQVVPALGETTTPARTAIAYEPASEEPSPTEPAEKKSIDQPQAMPGNVQRMILAEISYPRLARRKGWQGRATFLLHVRKQKLASLDLSHSSGHSLLDSAAIRGIRAVEHLPLANGLYNLPVEFRLQ